jgi:hypothetical protein
LNDNNLGHEGLGHINWGHEGRAYKLGAWGTVYYASTRVYYASDYMKKKQIKWDNLKSAYIDPKWDFWIIWIAENYRTMILRLFRPFHFPQTNLIARGSRWSPRHQSWCQNISQRSPNIFARKSNFKICINIFIIFDHHIWSSYMISIHDHHTWSSYMIIIQGHRIWSSYMIIIYDHHMWSSYMIIINDRHIWSSDMMIIYDHHIWWSPTMIIQLGA